MGAKRSLTHGVGINDADYVANTKVDGVWVTCKFYQTWKGMLERCYSPVEQARFPTYVGCSVAVEWHRFMSFKNWMQKQDWHGKQLDKDILFVGNKIYSPDTCSFVDKITNGFTIDQASSRGEFPIGVNLHNYNGKFRARCGNPLTKKIEHLGLFNCPHQAHLAWKKRKHELACQLADLQTDDRVAQALRTRYL